MASMKYIEDNRLGFGFAFFHQKEFDQENESLFSCVFVNWSLGGLKSAV